MPLYTTDGGAKLLAVGTEFLASNCCCCCIPAVTGALLQVTGWSSCDAPCETRFCTGGINPRDSLQDFPEANLNTSYSLVKGASCSIRGNSGNVFSISGLALVVYESFRYPQFSGCTGTPDFHVLHKVTDVSMCIACSGDNIIATPPVFTVGDFGDCVEPNDIISSTSSGILGTIASMCSGNFGSMTAEYDGSCTFPGTDTIGIAITLLF